MWSLRSVIYYSVWINSLYVKFQYKYEYDGLKYVDELLYALLINIVSVYCNAMDHKEHRQTLQC